MVSCVEITSDAYLVCCNHVLSTDNEEVMGLLMGEVIDSKLVRVCSAHVMCRSDKHADRVEISPEQLSAAAIEAESLSRKFGQHIRVVGWYHSHPHITIWPSHVDVQTQADYETMDPNFIGVIFSAFNASMKQSLQTLSFQSFSNSSGDTARCDYHELPVSIVPSPHAILNPVCCLDLTHLPEILFDEEKQAYDNSFSIKQNLLGIVRNSGAYTEIITHILEVGILPLLSNLREESERIKRTLSS